MDKNLVREIIADTFKNIFNLLGVKNIIIILGIIVLVSLLKIFKPKIKGYIGEKSIVFLLNRLPKSYVTLNDILIETQSGSSQIDHIVVSQFGVFVLETKNYKGWIYGKENQKRWTQNIYGNKYYFQNPLHQNYGHIKRLQEIKGLESIDFKSLVLFSGEATLKNEIDNVIYFSKVNNWITKFKEIIYDEKEVEEIKNAIINNNILDKKSRRNHIKNINKKTMKGKRI